MLPLVLAATSALAPVPQPVVDGSNLFAQDLYEKLAKKGGNVVFSPASISTALTMTWAGATGDTAKQLEKALHLPPKDVHAGYAALLAHLDSQGAGDPELRVANRLFGQKGWTFEAPFLGTLDKHYGAPVQAVDFETAHEAARSTINAWVMKQTADRIPDLFPKDAITDKTRLVLANALYFKGKWATAFAKKDTRDEPFALLGANPKVPTMHAVKSFGYADQADAQVLRMAYEHKSKDRALSMVIVLPKAKDGVHTLAAKRAFELLRAPTASQTVDVSLPRFSATIGVSLNDTLKLLGVVDAFDKDKADFSGIIPKKKQPLYLQSAVHKAFVAVDEVGTEAAAATGVSIAMPTSVPPPPAVFKADHPFLWAIEDASGAILFMGRVDDPTKTS